MNINNSDVEYVFSNIMFSFKSRHLHLPRYFEEPAPGEEIKIKHIPFNKIKMNNYGNNIIQIGTTSIDFYLQYDTIYLAILYKYLINGTINNRPINAIDSILNVTAADVIRSCLNKRDLSHPQHIAMILYNSLLPYHWSIVIDFHKLIRNELARLQVNNKQSVNCELGIVEWVLLSKIFSCSFMIHYRVTIDNTQYKRIKVGNYDNILDIVFELVHDDRYKFQIMYSDIKDVERGRNIELPSIIQTPNFISFINGRGKHLKDEIESILHQLGKLEESKDKSKEGKMKEERKDKNKMKEEGE